MADKFTKVHVTNSNLYPRTEVPSLKEIGVEIVAQNFSLYPALDGIQPWYKDMIIAQTPVNLPIQITVPHINQESYWQRACEDKVTGCSHTSLWRNCRIEQHGFSWKQAYVETYFEELIALAQDDTKALKKLQQELPAGRNDIFSLRIAKLLPHVDLSMIFCHLRNLSELKVTYGAKHVGMDYDKSLFGMRMPEAGVFVKCITPCRSLISLSLPCNLIDDELMRMLFSGLIMNRSIAQLDLSHNLIGDQGAKRLAKYLIKTDVLTHLDLTDNQIHYEGSRCIGQALRSNRSLTFLSLKLNRLNDKAGTKFCIDLAHNNTVSQLNLSSNSLGPVSCEKISELLMLMKSLTWLDISCNPLTEESSEALKASLMENDTLMHLECRNTQMGKEMEHTLVSIVREHELKSRHIPYIATDPNARSSQSRMAASRNDAKDKVSPRILGLGGDSTERRKSKLAVESPAVSVLRQGSRSPRIGDLPQFTQFYSNKCLIPTSSPKCF